MSGIKAIDFSKITGRVIINLDCSDQGIVVGCAGSAVIRLELPVEREAVPGNWECRGVTDPRLKGRPQRPGYHKGTGKCQRAAGQNPLLPGGDLPGAGGRLSRRTSDQRHLPGGGGEDRISGGTPGGGEACLEAWERILKKEFKISDPDVRVGLAEPAEGWGVLTPETRRSCWTPC